MFLDNVFILLKNKYIQEYSSNSCIDSNWFFFESMVNLQESIDAGIILDFKC